MINLLGQYTNYVLKLICSVIFLDVYSLSSVAESQHYLIQPTCSSSLNYLVLQLQDIILILQCVLSQILDALGLTMFYHVIVFSDAIKITRAVCTPDFNFLTFVIQMSLELIWCSKPAITKRTSAHRMCQALLLQMVNHLFIGQLTIAHGILSLQLKFCHIYFLVVV